MVKSMTGYGHVDYRHEDAKINLEIRTVNHRFLDLSLKFPSVFNPYEDQIKAILSKQFKRGRIELTINSEGSGLGHQSIDVNWLLLDQYNQAFQSIQSRYPDTAQMMVNGLPDLTDIFQVTENHVVDQKFIDIVLEMVEKACVQVNKMRSIEGQKLAEDIERRISRLKELVNNLTEQREIIKKQHYQRMVDRLNDLLSKNDLRSENHVVDQKFIDIVLEMVEKACVQVNKMRSIEGQKLAEDIERRISRLKELVNNLTEQREIIKKQHYQRMVDRLNDLLSKNDLTQDDRFYRELAVLAEKGDLPEELIRIDSHIDQIALLLNQSGEVGRKLDFITQELIREANTIGSKANDPMISEYVVDLKATIEKIKEQVQNIE